MTKRPPLRLVDGHWHYGHPVLTIYKFDITVVAVNQL